MNKTMLSSKSCDSSVSHTHRHTMGFGTAPQPRGTIEYVTSSRDTLQSIAVSFDTTTSSLMKLNRMSSLTIFPGQTLYVPGDPEDEPRSPSPLLECEPIEDIPPKHETWDHTFTGEFSFLSPLSPSSSSMRAFKDLVMVSSKPDTTLDKNSNAQVNNYNTKNSMEKRKVFESSRQTEVIEGNDSQEARPRKDSERQRVMSNDSTESEPFEEGFLKMTVQYITDHKEMISGVMLVTPTALMFDPETDDPVAVRDGCDEYGIMCPMHLISSVAMYNDTSRMTPVSHLSMTESQSGDLKDASISSSSAETKEDNAETSHSHAESNSAYMNNGKLIEISETSNAENSQKQSEVDSHAIPSDKYHAKKSRPMPGKAVPAVRTTNLADDISQQNLNANYMQPATTDFPSFASNDKPDIENEKDESKLETEFPFLHSFVKTVGEYLPASEDVSSEAAHGKSSPPKSYSNHMFLCIRARRPMVKTFSVSEDDSQTEVPTIDKKPKDNSRLPEYWFQVPRKRSDHVYAFFLQWSPQNNPHYAAIRLGFVVMAEDATEDDENANLNRKRARTLTNTSLEFVDDFFDESYSFEKEWEIISIQEAKRRNTINAIELAEADDSLVPELEKPSNILTDSTLLSLCRHLPNRCIGYSWYPLYTTFDHGTSLRTLYRNMSNIDAPVVLVIKDDKDHIFGALCSNSLHISDHYYGTGESFLFTISPEFEVFKWTGNNNFFIKGDTDSIILGGGKGSFGLWLDSDLYRGCSHSCETYDNKVLSCDEDFVIQGLEVWVIKDM